MKIQRLDHLVLTVRDLEVSCQFYAQVLGMEVVTFGEGRKALHFGQQKINLHELGREFEPKAERATAGSADLCLLSETALTQVIEHLQQCGVEVLEGPVRRTGALGPIDSVYLRDPDGNLLEVSSMQSESTPASATQAAATQAATAAGLQLSVLAERLAVCRLEPTEPIPVWAVSGAFFAVVKTVEELSIVCPQSQVPDGVIHEANWQGFKVAGPLNFALTGILAALANPLAQAGISIFAVSTYDTDYLLVREQHLEQAIAVLRQAGHQVQA
ncbi:ACT domain-containing protein [Leptolyngbya sp. FACHB-261]|uniref:ACT domain-containing protein n=1 Tax=Leptolyngbya sp. FACHB-261 TaxID=2692806 RepID=UPI001689E594|nr:ACT domain-containing protein [Leptolyngbya sp. FACHB-261]MBD2104707.1 ACT domain-containing protein [Leptolyngbya sp. FACHB-261]